MQKGRDDVAPLLSFLSPPPSCVCVEGGSLPFLPPFFPFRVLDSPSPDSRLAGARFFPLGTQKGEGGKKKKGPSPVALRRRRERGEIFLDPPPPPPHTCQTDMPSSSPPLSVGGGGASRLASREFHRLYRYIPPLLLHPSCCRLAFSSSSSSPAFST